MNERMEFLIPKSNALSDFSFNELDNEYKIDFIKQKLGITKKLTNLEKTIISTTKEHRASSTEPFGVVPAAFSRKQDGKVKTISVPGLAMSLTRELASRDSAPYSSLGPGSRCSTRFQVKRHS